MADRSRKISELPTITIFGDNDEFLVNDVQSNTIVTSVITGAYLRKGIAKGPYANDSVSANSVQVGQLYYTSNGDVKVRLI